MTQPYDLYTYVVEPETIPGGLSLVAGFSGFTDSGHVLTQMADQMFSSLSHELVLRFENDELLDYRSRRPVMFFERDHIADYEPAVLGLYLMHDEANEPFLYLHGYEPDFKWEAFASAVEQLVEDLEVKDFTWVHAIPFPAPHTKPVGVTVSGNRSDIISRVSEWKPQTQVPGNVLHLIEYRLSTSDLPMAGLVMLVPHYLSDTDFPQAAVAAFEQVSAATGLVFPTDSLREQGVVVLSKIDEQVEKNEDLAKLIATLEAGYGSDASGIVRAPIMRPAPKIPSADELAEELEEYLANRRRNSADEN
ncbi:MAG: proteasome assembly chaperone family protein [Micrococcales bacterium]